MILEAFAAALVCIDPGHGTLARVGAQREPIGPGSSLLKIKDPGGAPGEAGSRSTSRCARERCWPRAACASR